MGTVVSLRLGPIKRHSQEMKSGGSSRTRGRGRDPGAGVVSAVGAVVSSGSSTMVAVTRVPKPTPADGRGTPQKLHS